MFYSLQPPWVFALVQGLRVMVYLGVAVSGALAIFLPPNSLSIYEFPLMVLQLWGVVVCIAGLLGAYGVASRRFPFETVSLPFIITALVVYSALMLWMTAVYIPTLMLYTMFTVVLALMSTIRLVELLRHATSLRKRDTLQG